MSKMSELALRLQEFEDAIAENSWSMDMCVAEMTCLCDLGFETEVVLSLTRGLKRWHQNGMPKGVLEVS